MKHTFFGLVLLLGLSCCPWLFAADTTPPQLASLSLSPANIDVSSSNQTILVTARITEDLSGLNIALSGGFGMPFATITLGSPSRNQQASVQLSAGQRASGNEWDGVYTNQFVLPRYSESGLWTILAVSLRDAAGNSQMLDYAALLRLGISAQFNVTGTNDTTPPQFVSFNFSPDIVDAGSTNRLVHFTARLKDDLSGFAGGSVALRSPSGNQYLSAGFSSFGRSSGDTQDGIYTNTVVFPQFCEPGVWSLEGLSAMDAAGNRAVFTGGKLLALGFPMSLTVTGLGDTNAPLLAGFSLAPTNINTSFSSQSIQVTAHVTDDLSGFGIPPGFISGSVGSVSATFASPSGRQSAGVGLGPSFQSPGIMLDTIFTNALTLPQYSEPGLWLLQTLTGIDNAGNRRQLDLKAAHDLGLPFSFMVEEFPRLRISVSDGTTMVSWPISAHGFRLQTSTSCSNPAAWSDVLTVPVQFGEEQAIVSPLAEGQRFYRLIERP